MKRPDGRRTLYEAWVRDYGADLYRCAFRLCGRGDCAEELTQEAFYEAWRSIDSLRDVRKARVWLLSILRHRYMHWLRDEKRRPANGLEAEQVTSLALAPDSPQELLERQEALQAALNALDDRYKLPFLLVFLEGMTCQQTADFLEIPLGTVLSRIHRARQFLREQLEKERPTKHMRIHRDECDLNQPPNSAGGGV